MKRILTVLVVCIAASAHAESPAKPAAIPEIKDSFAFDILNVHRSKCTKVTGALLAKIKKGYTCAVPEHDSASGKPVLVQCKTDRPRRSEFMHFARLDDCVEERDTQLANGG